MLACTAASRAQGVAACADLAGLPPFVYTIREANSGVDTAAGVSVDLLKRIAAENRWQLQINLLPWARCMLDARSRQYALVLNVVQEEAKPNHLLLSKPFYRLHGVYVYSGRVHSHGFVVTSRDQLLQMRICGMGGRRFEAFGIPTERVDRGTSKSFEQLVAKLHLDRCDVAIGTREEVAGLYLKNPRLSEQIADGSLRIEPLPQAPEPSLHFGVPEALPEAAALVNALNEGLGRIDKQGGLAQLIDQHLDEQNPRR